MILKVAYDIKGHFIHDIEAMKIVHSVLMAWIHPFHREHTKFSIFVTDDADTTWRLWQTNKLSSYVSVVLISNRSEQVPVNVWVINPESLQVDLAAHLQEMGHP